MSSILNPECNNAQGEGYFMVLTAVSMPDCGEAPSESSEAPSELGFEQGRAAGPHTRSQPSQQRMRAGEIHRSCWAAHVAQRRLLLGLFILLSCP